jgi:NHL repeat
MGWGSEVRGRTKHLRASALIGLLTAVLTCMAPGPAVAAAPEPLLRIPELNITPGSDREELRNARDLAGNRLTGHVYLSENANFRVSEYTAWGLFVRAWGWDVAPEGTPGDTPADQLEICTASCQAGIAGGGAGQFNRPSGIAVDANGDVYVYDQENRRVQKFSSAGQFLLTFGGKVNKTQVEGGGTEAQQNLCTAASGDVCQGGVAGPSDGYLSSVLGNYLAYRASTDSILVGDEEMVQEFGTDGSFKGKVELPGKTVEALDVDLAGNLYVAYSGLPNVHKLKANGEPATPKEFGLVDNPGAVAVDADGNVYVTEIIGGGSQGDYVVGFNSAGSVMAGMGHEDRFAKPEFPGGAASDLVGVASNLCPGSEAPNLYVVRFTVAGTPPRSYVSAYGAPPIGCEPPPARPPEISAQYAVAADTDGAVLKAQINPRFWADTTYYVEYGTSPCSSGGCDQQWPPPPGPKLTSKVINKPLTSTGVTLSGLGPGTTYHFRFVVQSGGGGPVFGIDPDGKAGPGEASAAEGVEGSFRTFREEEAAVCPNDRFRTDAGAFLPDCRSYEMVSPVEKANGDIQVGFSASGYRQTFFQGAESGERFTYAAGTAFAEPVSATFSSHYLARRDSALGWLSEAISPLRERLVVEGGPLLEGEFKTFTADLCKAWLRTVAEPPLAPGAVPRFLNLYRRENCPASGYEALTLSPPDPNLEPIDYRRLELQGISADGATAIYVAPDELSADAPDNADKRPQLYRHSAGGGVEFVCVLPGGTPTTKPCYAGTAGEAFGEGRLGSFHNAISADGSRVFWTESNEPTGPGRIFVKLASESGSRPVSGLVSSAKARFWGAADDGAKAIFSIEDPDSPLNRNLYRYDFETNTAPMVAEGILGVLGMGEDGRNIYFASTKVLTEDENSEGAKAVAGQANLYLEVGGEGMSFVGTLSTLDTKGLMDASTQSPLTRIPVNHAARVSGDGAHAVFMSTASLTGFDNTDANTQTSALEVFLYDAEEAELRCVSCNPGNVRPSGGELLAVKQELHTGIQVAAKIPTFERALYGSRVLSADGNRVFFESFEALVPRDSNGAQDVYQWERAGSGGCDEADATFAPDSGGCIDLISSGQSPRESVFVDADASGDNVFFTTLSSLLPQDHGLIDVYDARVGGGFPPPPPPESRCEGEACQSPLAPPEALTPAGSNAGPGNPPLKRPCRRAGKKGKKAKGSKARRCPRKHKAGKRRRAAR